METSDTTDTSQSTQPSTQTAATAAQAMTVEDKFQMAKQLKDEGNDYFKQEAYSKARTRYYMALAYTKGLPGREGSAADPMAKIAAGQLSAPKISKELSQQLDELDSVIKTNIATCYIKQNDGVKAMPLLNEALNHNKNNWKAKMRKAEAYLLLRDNEKCILILNDLSGSAPGDVGTQNALAKLRERANAGLKQQKDKQKKAFSNIFEKARQASETAMGSAPTVTSSSSAGGMSLQHPSSSSSSGNRHVPSSSSSPRKKQDLPSDVGDDEDESS